jgi:hypothetical protein
LWLCGQQFTAADINLCILLGRLDLLGIGERYHSKEKRPRTHAYWDAAKKRKTVKKVTVNAVCNTVMLYLGKSLKKALPIVGGIATVGLAAGLAFAFVQR